MKMNYKNYLAAMAIYFLPSVILSQVTFQKVYSSFYDKDGLDVLPTSDGGYIAVGMTTNNIFEDTDVYIFKTNSLGDIEWTKSYGGALPDFASCILKANDGNYFVLGYSQSFGGGDYDTYLLKINTSGDTLWTKTYGSYGNEQGREIVPTADDNYMIVGFTNGLATPDYNAYLTKINIDGDVIWSKEYGGGAYEAGASVKQCADGGYIMIGQTYSYGHGNSDAWIVKTNSTGDTLWTRAIGGVLYDEGIFTLENSDSSLMFCIRDSSSGAGDVDIKIVKTSNNGTIIWDKNYGGDKKDTGKMIQPTSDEGYIIAGHSRSFGWVNPDMWLIKINTSGDTLWTQHYGGADHEHCYTARQTSDGGFIAIGHTESFSSTDEIMMLKLNSIGTLSTTVAVDDYSNNSIDIYPNPSDGIIYIKLDKMPVNETTMNISNMLGQVVFSEKVSYGHNKVIDLRGTEPGLYFLTVQLPEKLLTKKISLHK